MVTGGRGTPARHGRFRTATKKAISSPSRPSPVVRGLLIGVVGVGLVGDAQAASPNKGFAIGRDGKFIPAVGVGLETSSNAYLLEDTTNNPAVAATNLMVNPSFRFELPTQSFELTLASSLTARKYLTQATRNLDRASDTTHQLELNVLPNAFAGLKVEDSFSVENRPTETPLAGNLENDQDRERAYLTQLNNGLDVYASIHPKGALTVDAGANIVFDNYWANPSATATDSSFLNSRTLLGGEVKAQWAFFPKTAIVAEVGFGRFDWVNNVINTQSGTDATGEGTSLEFPYDALAKPDGNAWKLGVGLAGRITRKLVVDTMVGYGQLRYDADSVTEYAAAHDLTELLSATTGWEDASLTSFARGLRFSAMLAYAPAKRHTFSAGYVKDYTDSWFTNYLHYHYVFARYEAEIARRWGAGAEFGYRLETYEGQVSRQDHVLRVDGELTYEIVEWLDVSASAGWRRRAASQNPDYPLQASREYDNVIGSLVFTFAY